MFNIYLMVEDGESFCIRAKTMVEATNVCERSYLEEMEDELRDQYNESTEKEHYHEHILESCSLVGQLKN